MRNLRRSRDSLFVIDIDGIDAHLKLRVPTRDSSLAT